MGLKQIINRLPKYGRFPNILKFHDLTVEPEALQLFKNVRRIKVFLKKGCTCVTCGLTGTILALTLDKARGKHWDLFADNGEMMTVDHILPKSLGGTNSMGNYQPMCSTCNNKKGNKIESNTEPEAAPASEDSRK